MFVVDISGSIEENNGFDTERSFMKELVYGLDFSFGHTRVAFITFANVATTRFYLNDYISNSAQQDVLNALVIDTIGHETDITTGIKEAREHVLIPEQGDRDGVDNIMVLISDGKNTIGSDEETISEALEVKDGGTRVYTVAIGENSRVGLLETLASDSSSRYWLKDRSEVEDKASEMLDTLCL